MTTDFTAPKQNLRLLLAIRWLLVISLTTGLAIAHWWLAITLPYATLLWLMLALSLLTLATHVRLAKPWPVTLPEFFGQILCDIIGVSLVFYFSGGASNPFVSYYLVPLTIALVTLPWRYTVAVALISISAYTTLLFFYLPIDALSPAMGTAPANSHAHHAPSAGMFNAHILGMWFNFIISAGLIAYFVMRMANSLKLQQQQLNHYREENLRDEQVLAVASLAAGTAHELGTPLTTMKVLLAEIRNDYTAENATSSNPQTMTALKSDLQILEAQVALCSNTLKDLVSRAEQDTHVPDQALPAPRYCKRILDRWLLLRPDVAAKISIQPTLPQQLLAFHSSVDQAIINLLNNAADARRDLLEVSFSWNAAQFTIVITDDGPGIPADIRAQLGQTFVTSKGKGLGLGIYLSNATVTRYQGSIEIVDRQPHGTSITIVLPIKNV